VFVRLCRARGIDYDRLLSSTVRAFAGDDFFIRIRHQPCVPLLRLLERRLTHPDPAGVARRVAFAQRALAAMSQPRRPGVAAAHHTHWVLPILTSRPDQLAQYLARHGFDATRTASSLTAVLPPASHPDGLPVQAIQMMNELVYIPIYPPLSLSETERLGRLMVDFETDQS
jgi:perosamine synthetase